MKKTFSKVAAVKGASRGQIGKVPSTKVRPNKKSLVSRWIWDGKRFAGGTYERGE